MPIENERKYVLRGDALRAAYDDLHLGVPRTQNLCGYYRMPSHVDQGYLPGNARIRNQRLGNDGRDLYGVSTFTYKIMTQDGLVEIEKMIEYEDFQRLWPLTRDRLRKIRFDECEGYREDTVHWDIDFFLDDQGEFYFGLAECEMPVGMVEPTRILPVLAPYIEYVVPPERQLEFTNVRLADPEYARSLKW